MVRVIYKHELRSGQYVLTTTLFLTYHAELIHVAFQKGQLCLWESHYGDQSLLDADSRTFHVVGTGEELTPESVNHKLIYIGTAIEDDYNVWHVYESRLY
jgi:hypothetical protein